MRTAILLSPVLMNLALLASCSSPPKPPTVEGINRRPVNTATVVELQVCKNDLQNKRLLAIESTRLTDSMAATLASVAARQKALADLQPAEPTTQQGNVVFAIRFGYGSTRVNITAEAEKALIAQARSAPLVMLRGRTDGTTDSLAESSIARERANAVRDHLVAAGIDASRIRATYQPIGDHVADNADAGGQALNRRVEIELYRSLPVAPSLGH